MHCNSVLLYEEVVLNTELQNVIIQRHMLLFTFSCPMKIGRIHKLLFSVVVRNFSQCNKTVLKST